MNGMIIRAGMAEEQADFRELAEWILEEMLREAAEKNREEASA